MRILHEFVLAVKQDCVIKGQYFWFNQIPDLIVKKGYSRKDYEENLLKVLKKVQVRFLAQKKAESPEKEVSELQVTDDDLVPLVLFDWVLSQIENKISERNKTVQSFIKDCQALVLDKARKVDSEKLKKIVEQNVLITHLNDSMEKNNKAYFTDNHIHRSLYLVFIRQSQQAQHTYQNSKEFERAFLEVLEADYQKNRFYPEYKRKLDQEMQKFNGRVVAGEGAETASEVTTATRGTKKSAMSILTKGGPASKGGSPERAYSAKPDDDLDEAATMKATPMEGTINNRDNAFDPDPMQSQANAMDEEDLLEEQRLEEEQKKNSGKGTQFQELFKKSDGQAFDPKKKFGEIDAKGSLIYDNITSSYPLNLPPDHYRQYIMDNLPKKESGSGNWFIRPHHLESLTKHPNSVKDDVLNTRYISHYDQKYGVAEEVNNSETAITKIETHLASLRSSMKIMLMQRGGNPEVLDELAGNSELERLGMAEYEKFIGDKSRFKDKELIIDAYEGVLHHQRAGEKDLLNKKRHVEHEKNRPPQENWFEMKGSGFQKELYRNRVALKPNNSNAVYLENLQDTRLY